MTVEDAAQILNDRRHRGDSWGVFYYPESVYVFAKSAPLWLTPFEAVAIAREYLRIDAEDALAALRRPLD